MSDDACDCAELTDAQTAADIDATDRWVRTRPATEARLPADMTRVLNQFFSTGGIETLDDFVEANRVETGGGSIEVEDLCHVGGNSDHVAETGNETYHFECFYDGIALAYLAGEPVEIRTKSPSGTEIEIQATPEGDVESRPAGAVMSFGIAAGAGAEADATPTVEDAYGTLCPYVKAFPSRESYLSWAAAIDGATIGLPLEAGMPIAAGLTK